MSRNASSQVPVEYPSYDGRPMAENDWQLHAIIDAVSVLDRYFEDREDVYVSGDLLIYYEEGNPKARAAPDVFVVFGVPKRKRPTYLLWQEGEVPAFVLEVASRGTWREDEGRKAKLYERLGVREYWQYDPTGEYLGVHLKGRRLVEGRYEPQPVVESLDGTLLLRSEALGLDLRVKGEEMYFLAPGTGGTPAQSPRAGCGAPGRGMPGGCGGMPGRCGGIPGRAGARRPPRRRGRSGCAPHPPRREALTRIE